jgi:hypothetical protein
MPSSATNLLGVPLDKVEGFVKGRDPSCGNVRTKRTKRTKSAPFPRTNIPGRKWWEPLSAAASFQFRGESQVCPETGVGVGPQFPNKSALKAL